MTYYRPIVDAFNRSIIVVGGIKDGSGKTTIATNIAIMKGYEKPNILLADGVSNVVEEIKN